MTMDAVAGAFGKLAKKCGVKIAGFYSLRHVHCTIADETRDQPACMMLMGHADGSISGHYREAISDDRLLAVTDHIHTWLFGGAQ